MTSGRSSSRGRLHARRPGFRILAHAALLAVVAGCSSEPEPDVLQLESGEVRLGAGFVRHDVRLAGVGAQTEISPDTVQATVGDAVAFHAEDALTHSVIFLGDRMDTAQVAFLDRTGQRRSPPLLSAASRWLVSLEGAPPGDYPFQCALHGGTGLLHVAAGSSQ